MHTSRSLNHWNQARQEALSRMEETHRLVATPTEHINHAFALALAAQFQGFCKDLHSEVADYVMMHLLKQGISQELVDILRENLVGARKLDRGNATPSHIRNDFGYFGLTFIQEVKALDGRNADRLKKLEALHMWRNAIAHHDFDRTDVQGFLTIETVRKWRRACDQLAAQLDRMMGLH